LSGASSTRVSTTGSMAISGGSTSITSRSSIKTSKLSVAGKVSASGISSSASGFSIPSFPAFPALPTDILDFATLIPGASEILSQVSGVMGALGDITALADVQSLMGQLNVAQLDTLLESATGFDVGNIVGALGGQFGVASLIGTASPLGLAAMVTGLNPASAGMLTDKLFSAASIPGSGDLVSQFVDKIPAGKIGDLAKNLSSGKLTELVTKVGVGPNVDKLFKGLDTNSIKNTITSLGTSEIKSVMSSLGGSNLRKVFSSLPEENLADLKNKLGSDLSKSIESKLNSLSDDYPIVV
jgi:hypothetical protein